MAYATGPCMCHDHLRYPFTADHVCEMVRNVYSGRVAFHDGDAEVAPGVTVHKIGGHSRGLQCVRVMTATGPVVLASDSSHFYENFEKGKVFPITVDVADVLDGYARLKSWRPRPGASCPATIRWCCSAIRAQQPDARHRAPARCGAARRLSSIAAAPSRRPLIECSQILAADLARDRHRHAVEKAHLARILVRGQALLDEGLDLRRQLRRWAHSPRAGTMKAATTSPRIGSGEPITPASATAGCLERHSSTSPGPMR